MKRRLRRHAPILALLLLAACVGDARADCEPYPVGPESPTGIVGCVRYGEGIASMWGGPGVARNDCTWPWTDCQMISISSHDTGITILVTPTMYCDCYTGTPDERLVDLDPAAVAALGLEPSRGLWHVTVTPVREGLLPDTAVAP
jgi:hypothetical protein